MIKKYIVLTINGMMISLGYATMIEKFQDFSFILLALMFAHLVLSSLYMAYGFLFVEMRGVLEEIYEELS